MVKKIVRNTAGITNLIIKSAWVPVLLTGVYWFTKRPYFDYWEEDVVRACTVGFLIILTIVFLVPTVISDDRTGMPQGSEDDNSSLNGYIEPGGLRVRLSTGLLGITAGVCLIKAYYLPFMSVRKGLLISLGLTLTAGAVLSLLPLRKYMSWLLSDISGPKSAALMLCWFGEALGLIGAKQAWDITGTLASAGMSAFWVLASTLLISDRAMSRAGSSAELSSWICRIALYGSMIAMAFSWMNRDILLTGNLRLAPLIMLTAAAAVFALSVEDAALVRILAAAEILMSEYCFLEAGGSYSMRSLNEWSAARYIAELMVPVLLIMLSYDMEAGWTRDEENSDILTGHRLPSRVRTWIRIDGRIVASFMVLDLMLGFGRGKALLSSECIDAAMLAELAACLLAARGYRLGCFGASVIGFLFAVSGIIGCLCAMGVHATAAYSGVVTIYVYELVKMVILVAVSLAPWVPCDEMKHIGDVIRKRR
ncbi:MAG: hypothetical protein IIY88_03920 [Eubacterium sp.]|nr:hypothetical protein [Eubacterium sp.]